MLAVAMSVAMAVPAFAQKAGNPSGVRVGLQITVGSVVAPAGFVGGGLAARALARRAGASEESARTAAYVGAWTVAGLSTSVVPPLMLRGGNYPASLMGTAGGGLAAAAVVWAGRHWFRDDAHCGFVCTTLGVVAFALPATGATIAYNNSR
ncbi:MAG: hypothetical protein U0163_14075 [Gemmatimonadaceae bacterium]